MKKAVFVLMLLSVATGGYSYYHTVLARPAATPQVIQTAVSQGDIVEAVQVTGTLQALQTVSVGSQVSGVVSALNADFNSIVKKDQIIAKLDDSLLQIQVDLQTAGLERQLGEIANQRNQLENDTKDLERVKLMVAGGLASRQQLDQADVQVKVRTAQWESAQKMLRTAQASLDQAKLNVSYTTIRSPIDGVVVSRLVDIGQTVQSSVNVAQFFTLATDLHVLRLTASVDEADIGKVRTGMPVVFTVDSYGSESFTGTVDVVTLNAQTQNNVVTYPVWITAPNPDLKLRPAMTANLRILLSTARGVSRIPNSASRFRPTSETYLALGLTPPAQAPRTAVSAGGGRDARAPSTGQAPPERGGLAGRASGAGAGRASGAGTGRARGAVAQTARALPANQSGEEADKIDELFAPIARPNTRATVWTWDDSSRKLNEIRVRLGVSDGQFSELLDGGGLEIGQQLVTGVVVPQTSVQRNEQNNIFGNAGRGGPPGGFPGGGFPGGGPGGGR